MVILSVVWLEEGATIYLAYGDGNLTEYLSEIDFTKASGELIVDYPQKIFLTVKASDEGLDSAFVVKARMVVIPKVSDEE